MKQVEEKVSVYRNLHTGTWSVRGKYGIVIDRPKQILLRDVKFKVSEAGRQRVLRTKRKNVHATVEGFRLPIIDINLSDGWSEIIYNPYKYNQFVLVNNDTVSVLSSNLCWMKIEDSTGKPHGRVWIKNN